MAEGVEETSVDLNKKIWAGANNIIYFDEKCEIRYRGKDGAMHVWHTLASKLTVQAEHKGAAQKSKSNQTNAI